MMITRTALACLIALPALLAEPSSSSAQVAPHKAPSKDASLPHQSKVARALSGPPGASSSWRKTFEDTFNGSSLSSSRWNTVWPWGNGYNDTFPDCFFSPNNVRVAGGNLRLMGSNQGVNGKKFTAAVVTTTGEFSQRYGYFEIRCRLPKGKGLWPAFWLLPVTDEKPEGWEGWYEIDVFEVLGHDTTTVHMNNIWPGPDGRDSHMVSYTGTDVSNGFHTFGLLWEPGRTRIYLDGVKRYDNREGVCNQPMYLLINNSVGGAWPTSWNQAPDATTPYPNYLEVDYVRVWERVSSPVVLRRPDSTATKPKAATR